MTRRGVLVRDVAVLSRVAVRIGAGMEPEGHRLFTFAESCTGGLLAASVASVPGASASFPGSAVTYGNSAKIELLSVNPSIIEEHGAVSGQCAAQMARGALEVFGTSLAVSVTGIAGPDGGSVEKPVGTVWFGLATVRGPTRVLRGFYPGRPRKIVQLCAVRAALRLVIRGLRELRELQ
jgi:PncC family amidohydrolase